MIRIQHIIALMLVVLLMACKGNERIAKSNLSYIYQEDPTIVHPEYRIYHEDDVTSTIYLRVKSSEILYSKNNPNKNFKSKIVFNVKVYGGESMKELVASDTIFLFDEGGPQKSKYLVGELQLQIPSGKKYMAEVTLDDQYRMQYVQDVLLLDKVDETSDQNFLLKDDQGRILFGYAFPIGSKITVKSKYEMGDQMMLKYFDRTGTLPSPPFADQKIQGVNFQADSVVMIPTENGSSFEIELEERGVYHFQMDEGRNAGLSLISVDPYYPEIKTLNAMVKPLRYITTKQEFSEIKSSPNLKKGLDDFWYNIAGNSEKASDIIKAYYSRVELTNRFFTSDKVGWKTDRGLIYIIYGPPDVVQKNEYTEKWIYNEKNNMMSVEFVFYKVDNPFSNNDYYLGRSGGFKSSWYRAIDNWRQGRIF